MIPRRHWPSFLLLAAGPVLWSACQTRPPERAALRDPAAPLWCRPAPDTFKVRVQTSIGDFVIEARRAWAPHGVDRFYHLVRAGFFDDARFFRVDANYIAQFGIPGRPEIAALWQNQTMPADPPKSGNRCGTLGYAMTAPDRRTTQLYINLKDNPQNDAAGFAPIARVVEGMDIVDRLYSGYGEKSGGGMRAGRQARLFAEGNAWLDRDFPKLDKLIRAAVVQ